jgi:uncharacterized protein (TIGR04255 family)
MLCTTVCNVAFEFVKRQPVLENSPLTLVICQLRFPRLIGLGESDLRPVQRGLAHDYPVVDVGRIAEFGVGPEGISATGDVEPLFHFRDEARAWTVTVTPSSLSLETTAYTDFTDFVSRWHATADLVAEALGIERQDRIGLRYVDELDCPPEPTPEDIGRVVRPELVGVIGAHPRTGRLISSMQELRFAQDRGVCTLRHGLVRRDGGAVYVLDYDFYDDQSQALDIDAQVRLLADFNHGGYELFAWSVPPEHFATFKPTEPIAR